MSNDREIYKESGMCDFVGKPFTSQELWRCLLKYLPPVNKESALSENADERLELDLDFQKSLKKLFVRNNSKKFEEIKEALDTGDIKLAHRIVHSLKSNAAQIRMTSLQKAAANIEKQLKDGKNLADSAHMALLKTELDAALSQLTPLLADENNSSGEPSAEQQEPINLLKELEVMLKNGNTECVKLTGALRAVEGSGLLIQQIEDFDFDAAHSTLAGLMEALK